MRMLTPAGLADAQLRQELAKPQWGLEKKKIPKKRQECMEKVRHLRRRLALSCLAVLDPLRALGGARSLCRGQGVHRLWICA